MWLGLHWLADEIGGAAAWLMQGPLWADVLWCIAAATWITFVIRHLVDPRDLSAEDRADINRRGWP